MLLKQSIALDPQQLADNPFVISHEVTQLKEYLRKNPKSLYATPQLLDDEYPKSIIVLRMKKQKREVLMTMINPMLLNVKETIAVEETQDQVEGTYLNIRHPQLHVAYLALPGAVPTEVTLSGKSALVFQQALRLTQGISIDMFGLRIDDYADYQNGTEEQRNDIIQNYIKALKEISEESLQDEDTREYIEAVEYLSENAEKSINDEFKGQLQDAYEEITAAEEKVKKEMKDDGNTD
ncbi:MAG: hypothetical protein NC218_01620 [Acetobacter sp.]|nr:hypothetical protein [Acetobacter sp.]